VEIAHTSRTRCTILYCAKQTKHSQRAREAESVAAERAEATADRNAGCSAGCISKMRCTANCRGGPAKGCNTAAHSYRPNSPRNSRDTVRSDSLQRETVHHELWECSPKLDCSTISAAGKRRVTVIDGCADHKLCADSSPRQKK